MALGYNVGGLQRGTTYSFRYRALNQYGWGSYSPLEQLLVAEEPGQPAKPVLVSSDDTDMQVTLTLNTENKGSDIETHEISVSGDGGLTYSALIGYDGQSTSYTLNTLIDSLATGQIYRIRLRARNSIGWGPYSADCLAAMTSPPNTPSMPTRDDSLSSKTSIAFSWPLVADNANADLYTGAKVLGYRIY